MVSKVLQSVQKSEAMSQSKSFQIWLILEPILGLLPGPGSTSSHSWSKPWKWEISKSTIFESKPHYFKTARQIFLLLNKINISIEFFRLRYIPGSPTKKVVPKIHGADLKNPPKSEKCPTNHGGARDRHPRARPDRRGPDPNFEAPHILKSSSIFKKFFSDRAKNL